MHIRKPRNGTDDNERYRAAVHAMQSGVAMKMNYEPGETTPKHLRVGVNSAHVSIAALVKLLIDKGIITLDEYTAANADQMEIEAESYRAWLQQRLGGNGTTVTLG